MAGISGKSLYRLLSTLIKVGKPVCPTCNKRIKLKWLVDSDGDMFDYYFTCECYQHYDLCISWKLREIDENQSP